MPDKCMSIYHKARLSPVWKKFHSVTSNSKCCHHIPWLFLTIKKVGNYSEKHNTFMSNLWEVQSQQQFKKHIERQFLHHATPSSTSLLDNRIYDNKIIVIKIFQLCRTF